MFVRIVTVPLKPHTKTEFARAIENSIIPLLRKQKGFLDEIAFVAPDGMMGVGISFWDSKEAAEAYERSAVYTQVVSALEYVTAGSMELYLGEVTNSTAHKITPALAA